MLTPQAERHIKQAIRNVLWPEYVDFVEDVWQEAHLATLRTSRPFEGSSAYTTWFYRIAINKALELRRKGKRWLESEFPKGLENLDEPISDSFLDPKLTPEERLLAQERREILADAIRRLAPRRRRIILEFVVRDKQDDFQRAFNGAEKALKFKAMERLREEVPRWLRVKARRIA